MTKYIANENGDWWTYVEGEGYLYVIDDEDGHIKQAMEEEEVSSDDDKFEKFIWRYGRAVEIGGLI